MRRLIYFVVSFIIWILLTWPFGVGREINLLLFVIKVDLQIVVAGLVTSAMVSLLFHELLPREHQVFINPVRLFWLLVYIPVFLFYVIEANLDVVYRALHPKMPINPGIVKIKTKLKTDSGITALANSITLTPGTLTVDLTEDGFLYIHWINVKSPETEEATEHIARRFEWYLEKIFE